MIKSNLYSAEATNGLYPSGGGPTVKTRLSAGQNMRQKAETIFSYGPKTKDFVTRSHVLWASCVPDGYLLVVVVLKRRDACQMWAECILLEHTSDKECFRHHYSSIPPDIRYWRTSFAQLNSHNAVLAGSHTFSDTELFI
jgi:hypothetical protein